MSHPRSLKRVKGLICKMQGTIGVILFDKEKEKDDLAHLEEEEKAQVVFLFLMGQTLPRKRTS